MVKKNQKLIVVIHESIISIEKLLLILKDKYIENSYHSLIKEDGNIVNVNPYNKKIYCVGEPSSFYSESINNSVDPFSIHICLITPSDKNYKEIKNLQGFTNNQYKSLAWIIKQLLIPWIRITTHKEVDMTNKSKDPLIFDYNILRIYYLRTRVIKPIFI